MKMIISVEENNTNAQVADVFGRARFFAVVSSKDSTVAFFENLGAKSPNGAGIKAAQQVVDLKAKIVILPRIGKNGSDLLEAAGILLYKKIDGTVKENIDAFYSSNLKLLDEVFSGFHGSK